MLIFITKKDISAIIALISFKNSFMKNLILVFLLFLSDITFSQKQFNYLRYVDNTVRTGVLLFNEKKNTAVYIDQMNNLKKTKIDEKPIFTVSVSGTNDFIYYKQEINKLNYTYELLKIPYFIDDTTLLMNWELSPDKKEIQGLICNKATAMFRGRKWTAWYCADIPIVYGPWKFYGLPGLMVEITEDTNRFAFVLTEIIEDTKITLPELNLKKYKQVDIKSFDQIFSDAMNLKSLSSSRDYTIEGEPYKRNGIELIYEWEEEQNK